MTIAEFLLARIDDDERASQKQWADTVGTHSFPDAPPPEVYWPAKAAFDRSAREVAAKRAIVHEHDIVVQLLNDPPGPFCGACGDGGCCGHEVDWPCSTLESLAAIYADHPDYREEWKPS